MTKENRIKEIINAMQSFSKDAYHKEELLPEYLELQKELINLTFNDSHAENGKLRIWDVENHLEKLNEECGHIADEELEVFKEDSKFICNAIKSEFSGNAGEYKAFRSLETLRCKNKIMKNIEFKSGDHRTEIDAIVFTEKAVFIIEVKNPHRDIYIDERGNYCRVGDTMHLDCNIGEKMNDKVYLLREALKSAGYSNANIVSLVVFTNSSMHVDNRYDYITTCFLGNLPHIIERYDGKPIYNDSSISAMMESVSDAECKEAYPLEIDINQYKYRFANLMATLEEAAEKRSETVDTHEADNEEVCQETVSEKVSEMPKSIKKPADKTRSTIVAAVGIAVAFGAGFIVSQIFGSNRK